MTEPATGRERSGRLKSLDALRGVAAMVVLFYHFTRRYGELELARHFGDLATYFSTLATQGGETALTYHALAAHYALWQHFYYGVGHQSVDAWRPLFSYDGQFGVLLFFMISGYVITLTTERVRRPVDFLFFRFSRLYPTYWFCMIVTTVVVIVAKFPPPLPTALSFGANLTMLTKTLRRFLGTSERMQYIDGSYWSLEIELFFYAVVLGLLLAKGTHRIVLVAIGFVSLALLNEVLHMKGMAELPSALQWLGFLEYWPYFGIGIAVFARQKRGERIGPAVLTVLCVVCMMMDTAGNAETFGAFRAQMVKVLVSAVVFVLAVYDALPPLRWRVLAWLGAISYPLYLLHQTIGYVVIHWAVLLGLPTNAAIGIAIVVALALGTVVSYGVERPTMHALRRLYLRVAHHPAPPTPISGLAPTIPETAGDQAG